jgi:hypothetical protein
MQVLLAMVKSKAFAPLKVIAFSVARVPAGPSTAATRIGCPALAVATVWLPKAMGAETSGVPWDGGVDGHRHALLTAPAFRAHQRWEEHRERDKYERDD